jgi:hypothetical protein
MYDSSSHILYFKNNYPGLKAENGPDFSIMADKEELYRGVLWPSKSAGCFIPVLLFQYAPSISTALN